MKHEETSRGYAVFVGSVGVALLAAQGGIACGPSPIGGTGGTGGSSNACVETLTQGAISGKAVAATCEYLGVPYAAPPVGALRFMPPEPASAWSGVLNATSFKPWCIQSAPPPLGYVQSEDCLYLNVYTPKAAPTKPLPVMVFIHGGGFKAGAGSIYDAQSLSERGPAVVVTINYRLGPLGYLALPELDAQRPNTPSGSDGIRDQQLALAWVKNNAEKFHGDPANVTVFGESAGSHSTCIHLVSPKSQGLAQRYIMESGFLCTVPEAVLTQQQAYSVGSAFAQTFCPSGDVVACLRKADPVALSAYVPKTPTNQLGIDFIPIVDGPGGVLPEHPQKLIEDGQYNRDAAIIAGTNKYEWGLFDSPLYTPTTVTALNQAIDKTFGCATATGPCTSIAPEVKALYPAANDAEAQRVFDTLMTDYLMRCRTRDLARATAPQGSRFFLYSYDVGRAYHADELLGLFKVDVIASGLLSLGATIPSPDFQATMQGYWTRFAATGDPNGGSAPAWPRYDLASEPHLALMDPTPAAGANLQKAQCEFWAAHHYAAAPSTAAP